MPTCVPSSPVGTTPGVLLERIVAGDLFVVPLDDEGRWYRYHHLFGAFLRARLALRGEAQVRAARERASRALEARVTSSGRCARRWCWATPSVPAR